MERTNGWPAMRHVSSIALIVLWLLGGTAASRILYEALFPRWLWLGRPVPVLILAAGMAVAYWWLWRGKYSLHSLAPVTLLPLLLNLLYLFDPAVDLIRSRFIFAASIWLVVLLGTFRQKRARSRPWLGIVFVILALLPAFLLTMPSSVGRADTFEFQVIIPQLGIAHPTGYPLYLLLGKLFTYVPGGSMAWRINLGSAVFALVAASLVFLTAYRLLGRPVPAVLAATTLGLTPTFWSQAIEAEVYALHALVVSLALLLMTSADASVTPYGRRRLAVALLLVVGLGLTNHITSVFMLPAAALTLWYSYRAGSRPPGSWSRSLLLWVSALATPLLLYAYLPIRWAAVNGEPMGMDRFLDWVVGGRFQDALRWGAWLNDPTRYEIVGRLFLENWGWLNLLLAGLGMAFLAVRRRRVAILFVVTWLGYTFYVLNYHVPDVGVFLIPAHLVMAVCWAAGVVALLELGNRAAAVLVAWPVTNGRVYLRDVLLLGAVIPTLLLSVTNWTRIDRSGDDGLTEWGHGVLELPLVEGAAILADSEKIAPLYYLQQSEGIRPDLEIMVLPDEAAYRSELDSRIAAGQTVYLARFLPGLAGIYHLRSAGPLTEVSNQPETSLPADATPTELDFGSVDLVGFAVEPESSFDSNTTAVSLYWRAAMPVDEFLTVYIRWNEEGLGKESTVVEGQHPANNSYPTVAWQPGEIVTDFHLISRPVGPAGRQVELQIALALPFTSSGELAWQTLTKVTMPSNHGLMLERPLRAQIGALLIDAIGFPTQIRPHRSLRITVSGFGSDPDALALSTRPGNRGASDRGQSPGITPSSGARDPFVRSIQLPGDLVTGEYEIVAQSRTGGAICGWVAPVRDHCVVGIFEVSGADLPDSAANFDDRIALLSLDVGATKLQPGGRLNVDLVWTSLAAMDENYTVFVQVLDAQDNIVGQVDAWPVQGTYPTSQWPPGETISDSYVVQLDNDLSPGAYRLQVGWYLLATLRRLPVLDQSGSPIDDKVSLPGLVVR